MGGRRRKVGAKKNSKILVRRDESHGPQTPKGSSDPEGVEREEDQQDEGEKDEEWKQVWWWGGQRYQEEKETDLEGETNGTDRSSRGWANPMSKPRQCRI